MCASIEPFDALVSPEAKLDSIQSGFGFTEGIPYVQPGNSGYLLMSDMPAKVIYKLTYKLTADGMVTVLWKAGRDQTHGKDPQ